jgi:hypothetical protein
MWIITSIKPKEIIPCAGVAGNNWILLKVSISGPGHASGKPISVSGNIDEYPKHRLQMTIKYFAGLF